MWARLKIQSLYSFIEHLISINMNFQTFYSLVIRSLLRYPKKLGHFSEKNVFTGKTTNASNFIRLQNTFVTQTDLHTRPVH